MILNIEELVKIYKVGDMLNFVLTKSTIKDLKIFLKSLGIKGYSKLNKAQLVNEVLQAVKIRIDKAKLFSQSQAEEKKLEEDRQSQLEKGELFLVVSEDKPTIKNYKTKAELKEKSYFMGIWDENKLSRYKKMYLTNSHPDNKNKIGDFNSVEENEEMLLEYDIRICCIDKPYISNNDNMYTEQRFKEMMDYKHRHPNFENECTDYVLQFNPLTKEQLAFKSGMAEKELKNAEKFAQYI